MRTAGTVHGAQAFMNNDEITIGWREWLRLPDLDIDAIKAKVDTGARTSCLHAFRMETYGHNGGERVRFWIHPLQYDTDKVVECDCPVHDWRRITDSGGHAEERVIIVTDVVLAGRRWPIEVSLTSRETMRFRMLLGRTAMEDIVVRPRASFLLGGTVKSADS